MVSLCKNLVLGSQFVHLHRKNNVVGWWWKDLHSKDWSCIMVEIWQLFVSNFYPSLRDISNLEEKFSKDRIQLNSSENFCKHRIQFSSNSSENFSKNRIQFSSGSENLSKDRIQFSSGSKNLLKDSIQFSGSSQMSSEGEFVNRDYVFVVNPTGEVYISGFGLILYEVSAWFHLVFYILHCCLFYHRSKPLIKEMLYWNWTSFIC